MSAEPLRLTPLTPDQLDDESRKLYDAVLASPRGEGPGRRIILRDDGSLSGPFDAWLRTPEVGIHLERAGMAFRTDTVLAPAAREVATLVVARAWGADFEWWVHGVLARRQGVSEEVIDAIGQGVRPDFDDPNCAATYDVAVGLVHHRAVDRETLERAREILGERALIEAVTLVGFYLMVSSVLVAFEPPAPSGDLPVVGPPTSGDLP
jgi:4-carboxymuconolactone decarboxylase